MNAQFFAAPHKQDFQSLLEEAKAEKIIFGLPSQLSTSTKTAFERFVEENTPDIMIGEEAHYSWKKFGDVFKDWKIASTIPFNAQHQYGVSISDIQKAFKAKKKLRLLRQEGVYYFGAAFGNADPKAYKVWQSISTKRGYQREVVKERGKNEYLIEGAWDSDGTWGASPWAIDRLFFLAGCKISSKYYGMLHALLRLSEAEGLMYRRKMTRFDHGYVGRFFRKHHSPAQIENITRGLLFLIKRQKTHMFERRHKHVEILGRVSLPLRYAMLKDYGRTDKLNFEFAAEVQKWTKEKQSTLLSPKEAWFFLYGRCPFEGKNIPHPYALASWKKGIGAFIYLMQDFGQYKESMMLPIFNLCCLFGSKSEIIKFQKTLWAQKGCEVSLHDVGQFTLPSGNWIPKFWAGFCQKYPEAIQYAQLFGKIESNEIFPKSLKELRAVVGSFHYENCKDHEELANACHSLGLSQEQFDNYKNLVSVEKKAESLPHVDITNGDYRFYKLSHNDVRGPLLGLYTNCCQHLDGAASACAKHGWIDPTSGFYVVEHKGKIVAQSWAWRSKKSDLVFDSIEGLSGYDVTVIASLYIKAALEIIGQLSIQRVLVGETGYGLTSRIKSELDVYSKTLQEEMISPCSYMDSSRQWLLCSTGFEPKKFKKSLLPEIQSINLNCNILMDGSGVFCEHCDAEVHPECEICPSCHENIAEWV